MKKTTKIIALITLLGVAVYECTPKHASTASNLPQNVLASCTLVPDTFKTWFVGGVVTPNGLVTPANSVGLIHNTNCQFYQWAERMFLWVTSPTNGSIVLQSNEFYSVSPADSISGRPLKQNTGGPLRMSNHISKLGPDRLPVIRDNKGHLFEVETAGPDNKDTVKDGKGKLIAVSQVKQAANTFLLLDASGNTIDHPHAVIRNKGGRMKIVHRFGTSNKFLFLDDTGNEVQSDEGQATGDMLMTRDGSLVYYLTMVNDVYAWFRTMTKTAGTPVNKFPTTAGELKLIKDFAALNGHTLLSPNTLAMEMKSSWVEASTLADTSSYILVTATIPTYNKISDKLWVPNGEKTVRMAMVGIHVVGSVAGHPEMVWSTFEHQNNVPLATYQYLDSSKNVQTVAQDTGHHWLFSNNASDTAFNISHIKATNPANKKFKITDTVFANPGYTISPSNTLGTMPWGSAYGQPTNAEDKSSAASNSEVISLNNAIRSMLGAGDKRANYLFIGATWTANGAAPNGKSYSTADTTAGVAIGTSVLANSTMETYIQGPTTSCFFCHSGSKPTLLAGDISHIFKNMNPLPTKSIIKKH
ncbi:MAG: hypothetical protein ACXVAY_04370 [Mucilaginibacter sp.]